jgi:hypothetical protein
MPLDSLNPWLGRYVDINHKSIVVVQIHVAVTLRLKSRVRGLMTSRTEVLKSCSQARFYPGLGCYDFGYFKYEDIKAEHKVIVFFKYINSSVSILLISFVLL